MKQDKKDHLMFGMATSLSSSMTAMSILFVFTGLTLWVFLTSLVIGVFWSVVMALGKDVIMDKLFGMGQFEWLDIWYTVKGGLIGSVIGVLLVSLVIRVVT